MATLNITVDDSILLRVRAAYGAATNADLRNAIISDIKSKVKTFEIEQVALTEQAKVVAAETAKWSATTAAEQQAESQIIVT